MELFERIRTLADASGVSGNETGAALTALEMLREFCPDAVYENGNVIGHLGVREPGKPHVLIDAHIDQIGMIVTDIEENGFLRIGDVGGLDRRLMPAQSVLIHGRELIGGVICTIPPTCLEGRMLPCRKWRIWQWIRAMTRRRFRLWYPGGILCSLTLAACPCWMTG